MTKYLRVEIPGEAVATVPLTGVYGRELLKRPQFRVAENGGGSVAVSGVPGVAQNVEVGIMDGVTGKRAATAFTSRERVVKINSGVSFEVELPPAFLALPVKMRVEEKL